LLTTIDKPSFELPGDPPGTRRLICTFSTNGHLEYSSNGDLIAGFATLEIPPPEAPAAVAATDDPATSRECVTSTLTLSAGVSRNTST